MRREHDFRAIAVLTTALAAAACGDSTDLEPLDDPLVMDAAILAADATIEEVRLWSQPLGFGDESAASPGLHPGHGPGQPGGHDTFGGEYSGTRSVTFYDADGVPQSTYDPLTTASIHLIHEVEGGLERERFTAEVARSRDMTVSGLEGEETERTWNGSGSSRLFRSGVLEDGSERSHTAETTFSFSDVVVPMPGTEPRYPVSGTITRTITLTWSTPDGTRTREVEVIITFDGSEIATALVNGELMEIDLSARDGQHPLRRARR